MAKPWSQVEANPEYQALADEDKLKAKTQYFDQVVATKPEFFALADEQKAMAKGQFFESEAVPENRVKKLFISPVQSAVATAIQAGIDLGKPIGKSYADIRQRISKGISGAFPENSGMDTEFPISMPNPMFPAIQKFNIPLGKTTPRKSIEEATGMLVDEAATLGIGGVAKLGVRVATGTLGQSISLIESLPKIVQKGVFKGIKPSTAGKATIGQMDKYMDDARRAVGAIYDNKKDLGLVDEGGEIIEKLPENLTEFSRAIGTTKEKIFSQYDALTKQADKQGAKIDFVAIGDNLLQSAKKSEKVLKTVSPQSLKYMNERAMALKQAGQFTAEEAQDAVKILNQSLDGFYKNPTYDAASKAVVDAGIANAIRKSMDSVIENATGSQYQALRNIYKSLKTIENDVTKRAVIEGRKAGKGLIDFSDIFSGAEIVRGIVKLDAGSMATGTTAKTIAAYIKRINSPNQAIKTMFKNYDKAYKIVLRRA